MFLIVLILALVGSYYGYDVLKKWLLVQKYKHIPGPPPESFFAGNQKQLGPAKGKNEFLEVFISWVDTYGETFKFFIKTRPVIFSIDPDVLKLITTDIINFTKVDHLPNRSLFGQRITGTHSILTGGKAIHLHYTDDITSLIKDWENKPHLLTVTSFSIS